MAAMTSDALHSPRGGSSALDASVTAAGAATVHSAQYRRRGSGSGGGGGVSSPWTQIVRGPDLEVTLSSSSSPTPAVAPNSTSVAAVSAAPPPLLSPPLSGGAEEQIINNFHSDRSPSKAAAAGGASTSFSPEDAAGDAQPEVSEKSDNGSGGGSNAAKKPAWNRPSNGGTEISSVMWAESWPALSATRPSPKTSSDLPRTHSDVSLPVSQGTGPTSPSANKQGPTTTVNSNSSHNHAPSRQRSMKRTGGNSSNNSSSNGGISQLPSPRYSGAETTHGNSGKHANSTADSSSKENTHREGGQKSQSHSGNEHQQQRNSYRRGSHPRSDGPNHHGYGNRRGDQDRGNQDWNSNRSFGGRDPQVQQQRVAPRPFIRGPPPNQPQPFFPPAPLPVRPVGNPIYFQEMPFYYVPGPYPDSFRAVSMVPQMPQMLLPSPDPQLHAKILNQIDYYFSNENLIKDTFLRNNMDDQGWVPIKLIASFKKVSQLTENVQLILDTVRSSSVVEVEGEKVRRRNDWSRWIIPNSAQHPPVSSPQSLQSSSQDMLAATLQSIGLEDKTAKHGYAETYLSSSSSGEWSSLSQQSTGEKTGQVGVLAGLQSSAPNSSK
ncbi:OLC1v1011107C1 [Oldenlandia corymbosa var. corymbosa]|uniref:OLC1v1011107C1 n=1 Tax=Oldenlandia corymbosa var. corymbosa TaxID=529605 RepID=A0AAV1DSX7_OLDCO|nr:OLC1v1011107C1 [Oldenlandia corymbosa var. corymbosa]